MPRTAHQPSARSRSSWAGSCVGLNANPRRFTRACGSVTATTTRRPAGGGRTRGCPTALRAATRPRPGRSGRGLRHARGRGRRRRPAGPGRGRRRAGPRAGASSNWGFTMGTMSPPGATQCAMPRSSRVSEMNETSATASATRSGSVTGSSADGSSRTAWVRSMLTTRGSFRSARPAVLDPRREHRRGSRRAATDSR